VGTKQAKSLLYQKPTPIATDPRSVATGTKQAESLLHQKPEPALAGFVPIAPDLESGATSAGGQLTCLLPQKPNEQVAQGRIGSVKWDDGEKLPRDSTFPQPDDSKAFPLLIVHRTD